jgi:hypothetical protein
MELEADMKMEIDVMTDNIIESDISFNPIQLEMDNNYQHNLINFSNSLIEKPNILENIKQEKFLNNKLKDN